MSSARSTGDLRRISTALSDLGLALLYEGDARRASEVLTESLDLSRQVGDPAAEADALSNLAYAANTLGEPARAVELLQPVLDHARSSGDGHAEKLALDRLSAALFALGDRDRAISCAESAIRLFDQLGNPAVSWYAHHLAQYRSGTGAPLVTGPIPVGAQPIPPAPQSPANPGLLRMALTATKAMASFVGSGFKTTPGDLYRDRLTTCATCPHHTGLRCRICGCITPAKARLLHERCPDGRWTA